MKRKIWKYGDVIVESGEEFEFCHWLDEALASGFVLRWSFAKNSSFPLSENTVRPVFKKTKTTFIYEKPVLCHVYTPDFIFVPSERLSMFDHRLTTDKNGVIWVDTKGGFGRYGDKRIFAVNQKWVYKEHGVWVNKIVPKDWFKKTWVPRDVAWKGAKRPVLKKAFVGCRFIDDFIDSRQIPI